MSTANGTAFTIDPKRAAESNAAVFTAVICVVWGLAFVTACVRFYTRAVVVRSFGKDDTFMVLAVLCGVGGLAAWIIECKHGYGRHQDTIRLPDFVQLMEGQFYQSVFEASFAFGFLKISIALSLLRLSRGHWYNRILWMLIAFTCFYTLFAFVTFLAYCQPVAGQWNGALHPKCYSRVMYRNFGLFNAACNIFTDISFATLPIPLIWSLQLQRRVRLYLIAILSGGYFAVALGIVKAIFIIAYVHETDGTFIPGAPFFGSLQLDIGIIAACAPTLKPLLGRALRLSSSTTAALDPYRGANYYRAGKALDRLPPFAGTHNRNYPAARAYIRRGHGHGNGHAEVWAGELVELVKYGGGGYGGATRWAASAHRGDECFSATVIHAEHVRGRGAGRGGDTGEGSGEEGSSEGEVGGGGGGVLQVPRGADGMGLRGIVKTMEVTVEK